MTTNPLLLDMLGDPLKSAVTEAQARLADETIMARIDTGLCLVERGEVVLVEGLSMDEAVAYLAGLA